MKKWVSTFGVSESFAEKHEQDYAKNLTLRYIIKCTATGSKVRLKFSNFFTDEKVVLDSVTIAKSDGTATVSDIKKVTFNKKSKLKMSKNGYAVSDEIDYSVNFGEFLAVSIYFKKMTNLSTGVMQVGQYSYGFICQGDFTEKENFPLYVSRDCSKNYFLIGLDVLTKDNDAIVCFGDSITAQYWPDHLKEIIVKNGDNFSVVRKAISGARVLRTYSNWLNIHYGEAGITRIERDLSRVSGAKAIVVLHGINDIIHPDGSVYRPFESLPTAEELILGYKKYVAVARKFGLKVYFATVIPFGNYKSWSPEREEIRAKLNAWIRNLGDEDCIIDGFIDFDKVVQDEKEPTAIKKEWTTDWLHPTVGGAQKMAEEAYKILVNIEG